MRYALLSLFIGAMVIGHAQVMVDAPLRFIGDAGAAGIDGLAPPTDPTSLITAGFAASGAQHWATANVVGDTLILNSSVQPEDYSDGMLLRFQLNTNRVSRTFIRVLPLPAVPLVRSDGLDPVFGDLPINGLNEIIHVGGRFILLSARNAECPANSVRVNANFCMQTSRKNQVTFAQAITYCADRGGRLCTWDEFYAGCTLVGDQLQNLHSDWEWLNDMSDHTHSADQIARTDCTGQRSSGPSSPATARCCFSTR